MKLQLNFRGRVFLTLVIILIALSVILRSPPIILIAALGVAYLVSFPILVRNYEAPKIKLKAKMRHGILYRGEIDVLHITIDNNTNDNIPLAKLEIQLPTTLYLVNQPNLFVFGIKPNSQNNINVTVLPTARGSYSIGPIKLKIGDPFFLFEETIQEIKEIVIRVYPKRLGYKVSKAKTHRVFNRLIGLFSTTQKGYGTDFHGLRDYIRGDPSKIVEWAATARKGKLISKEFEQERRLDIYIAVAAGTTARGSKFDFMLGLTMDLFEGIIQENHPVGIIIFDDEIIHEFPPSASQRKKLTIWTQIYSIKPRDVYADYEVINSFVKKKGITGSLIIILGDLEYNTEQIGNVVRDIQLKNNNVIFLDIWGYAFTYETELNDAAIDRALDNYGLVLSTIIGRSINQDNIFLGYEMKQKLIRYGAIYGFLTGPNDNIIEALDRALYSYFGKKWKW